MTWSSIRRCCAGRQQLLVGVSFLLFLSHLGPHLAHQHWSSASESHVYSVIHVRRRPTISVTGRTSSPPYRRLNMPLTSANLLQHIHKIQSKHRVALLTFPCRCLMSKARRAYLGLERRVGATCCLGLNRRDETKAAVDAKPCVFYDG